MSREEEGKGRSHQGSHNWTGADEGMDGAFRESQEPNLAYTGCQVQYPVKGCCGKWRGYRSTLNRRVYNLFHLSTRISGTNAMCPALERIHESNDWIERSRPGYSCS